MSKDLTPPNVFELIESPENGADAPVPSMPAEGRRMLPLEEEEGGTDLRRYLAALLRNKWWILLITVLGTAAGFAATKFVEPEYQTTATLWIETTSPQEERTGPIRPAGLLQSSSWIELLRTPIVLQPVVRELELFVRPADPADSVLLAGMEFDEEFRTGSYRIRTRRAAQAYVLETSAGEVLESGAFGDSVGRSLGVHWAPALGRFPEERPVEFQLASIPEVAGRLGMDLEANMDRNGNFLQIALSGTDPERLATTINLIAERYVEQAAELKRARLDELVGILAEQVDYSAEQLRGAEIALEDFRVQTVTLPADRSTPVSPGIELTRDPVFANFFQMQVELEQIRRDQDMMRRVIGPSADAPLETLRSIEAVRESPELESALAELNQKRAELRALRYQYTDEHPPVRRLIEEIRVLEQQTLPSLGRQVMAELEARENQIQQRVVSASAELERIPPRAIEETRLERGVESADNLYSTLLRRYEEARLAAASSIPDVRVLSPAPVPRQPIRNDGTQLILLAMLGSFGLGIGGAILRDRMDRRLRYADEVTDELGLTILAGIPRLRIRRKIFGGDNRSQAQEAFRSLRLNLMHAYGSAGPVVVTVTSPGPGDGKSFVSANLARAFADIGKRTIIVDGDTRRGQLHEILGVERKPGLIDLLRDGPAGGGVPFRPTAHDHLSLLPSGSRVQEAPELLSGSRMRDLIMFLRSKFDVVIVDSPPLGAGVDPFILGTLTGAMVLVLRTGETDRELADAKLELLDRLPIRLLGSVLNGVPNTREYQYYAYAPGYETRAENDVPVAALLHE